MWFDHMVVLVCALASLCASSPSLALDLDEVVVLTLVALRVSEAGWRLPVGEDCAAWAATAAVRSTGDALVRTLTALRCAEDRDDAPVRRETLVQLVVLVRALATLCVSSPSPVSSS